MRGLFAVLVAVLAVSAHAQSGRLLDCNTPVGPDQEVTVTENGESLMLTELTDVGSEVSRQLSQDEWSSKTLNLRDGESTLAYDRGEWIVRSSPDIAPADCR